MSKTTQNNVSIPHRYAKYLAKEIEELKKQQKSYDDFVSIPHRYAKY